MTADHRIALQTEPRVVEIGDDITLEFQPEVAGDVYIQRYADMAETAGQSTDRGEDDGDVDPKAIVERARRMRAATATFLTSFMLDESAKEFAELALPDRVYSELTRWVAEAYGSAGGKERGPGGSSNDSAAASPKAGNRSTRRSQAKGSKPGRGH